MTTLVRTTVAFLLLCSAVGAREAATQEPPREAARGTAQDSTSGVAGYGTSLTLGEVLEMARERSPRLVAARAMNQAAQSRSPQVAAFPDPELQVGVSSLELPGLSATMPASMAPVVGLAQGIPFPGKRGLRRDAADAAARATAATVDQTWWDLRTEVARVFFSLQASEELLGVQIEARALLESAELIAESRYASGSGSQTDVLRASVELARLDAEVERLTARRTVDATRLNGLLNLPAGTRVPPVDPGALGALDVPADSLRSWAAEGQPMLRSARSMVEEASARVELAHKDIWPDLRLALQYAQRPTDEGRKHMGGAMVGVTLPVFAGSKQHRARDEAEARRLAAQARLTETQAVVDAEIGGVLAELGRARDLLEIYGRDVLPRARAAVESALSAYRSGAVDFTTFLDAELALTRFEGEAVSLRSDYGAAYAELEAAVGRILPTTEILPWEAP